MPKQKLTASDIKKYLKEKGLGKDMGNILDEVSKIEPLDGKDYKIKKYKPKQMPKIDDSVSKDDLDWDMDISTKQKARKTKTEAGIPQNRYNLTELGIFMGGLTAKAVGKLLAKNGLRNGQIPTQMAFDFKCAEVFEIDVAGVRHPVKAYYWLWDETRDFLLSSDEEFRYTFNVFTVKTRMDAFREAMGSGNFELGETLYSTIFEGISEIDIPALKHVFDL